MKKIIVFMLCILVAASLFAASRFSGNTPDSAGNDPTQTVTFTIGDDMYSYNVGFSIDGNKASTDIDATSLILSESDKTKATNSSDLYVWWDIMTANAFDVTLTVSKPLTQTKVDGDPAEIDFTVEGAINDGETKPDKHETKAISVSPSYRPGAVPCDFRGIFPGFVTDMMREGIMKFSREMSCFKDMGAALTAPETRTSSPVRIPRNEELLAMGFDNLYPCGEGAGYAGGIVSAAVDGLRVARKIMEGFGPSD